MTLPLTPDTLAGAFEFLRTTPPYRGWRLPHADSVVFTVNRHKSYIATHQGGDPCVIEVSSAIVGNTHTLLWAIGHEMIHCHQFLTKKETRNTTHNADFRRKAEAACRYHGWDARLFI